MAKKKVEESDLGDPVERLYTEIQKDYGENIIVSGRSIIDQHKHIIPVTPVIDVLTSGGFEEGSWVGISGPAKTGKTSLSLAFAANAQKSENGSRPIFYSKVEGRFSKVHASQIQGLNLEKPHFNIIQSEKGKILTGQDHLDILTKVIKAVPNAVIILDSISSLSDEREMTDGMGTETRGHGAKVFSQFVRTMNNVVPVQNTIVIGITHLINNTSGRGAIKVERCGVAWEYTCDYRLRCDWPRPWKSGNKVIGLISQWKCLTSKNGRPWVKSDGYLRFGIGADRLFETMNFGVMVGLVSRAGAWYSLPFLKDYPELLGKDEWGAECEKMTKFQGAECVYQALSENPEWASLLQKMVSEVMTADCLPTDEGE